jgi:hypothetical protein
MCGCVGAGHAQRNAMAIKDISSCVIVKLASFIGLQSEHKKIEVGWE